MRGRYGSAAGSGSSQGGRPLAVAEICRPDAGQDSTGVAGANGGIIPGPGPDLSALGYDSTTAVYDITAKVVYLPDGTKLEAHSGLGNMLDDPARIDARNVGPTPPGTYDMKPREALFHGVPALRMTPGRGHRYLRAGRIAGTQLHAGPERRLQRLRVGQELRPFPQGLPQRRHQAPRRRHRPEQPPADGTVAIAVLSVCGRLPTFPQLK